MSYDAPFAGLKIIDLSQGIAGPYCGMLFAQHGANVIKVEGLGEGDWARALGVRYGSHTAFSILGNLGKRSVSIDLKIATGKDVLWRLLKDADVLIEGFRPGVMKRLGFGYDAVSAQVPRLLYLSVSGFGQSGPLAERPAMDPVLQAYTGLMNENRGEDGVPHRLPVIAVDMATALYGFQAVSAALYARRNEERGRHLDVSLMQAAAGLQSSRLLAAHLEGGTIQQGAVPGGVFRVADGWMVVSVTNDRDWQRLCAAMDLPDLAENPAYANVAARQANSAALYATLRPAFDRQTWPYWSGRLTEARLMHERLNSYADFIEQPHVKQTGLIQWLSQEGVDVPVPFPAVPGTSPLESGSSRASSPNPGQHTRDILSEHGYEAREIEALVAERAVASPE
jgi:crotonobetainyl-CoA:carnitine CoA-transferase CaiB-like acyl-CoA transferase